MVVQQASMLAGLTAATAAAHPMSQNNEWVIFFSLPPFVLSFVLSVFLFVSGVLEFLVSFLKSLTLSNGSLALVPRLSGPLDSREAKTGRTAEPVGDSSMTARLDRCMSATDDGCKVAVVVCGLQCLHRNKRVGCGGLRVEDGQRAWVGGVVEN